MLRKTNAVKTALYAFLLCSPVFFSCQDSNPLSPLETAGIADYLPLHQGYNKKYSFNLLNYFKDEGQYYRYEHKIDGECEIQVTQHATKTPYSYSTVKVSFFVSLDKIEIYQLHDHSENVEENFTRILEYDLLQYRDSLWYVTDAPDFFRMEEGTRTLMMHNPEKLRNYLDLRLLAYPGWNIIFNGAATKAEICGDTLIYSVSSGLAEHGTIKLLKNRGISSIEYAKTENVNSNSPKYTTITYTAIE